MKICGMMNVDDEPMGWLSIGPTLVLTYVSPVLLLLKSWQMFVTQPCSWHKAYTRPMNHLCVLLAHHFPTLSCMFPLCSQLEHQRDRLQAEIEEMAEAFDDALAALRWAIRV